MELLLNQRARQMGAPYFNYEVSHLLKLFGFFAFEERT
jgi:hypothetical protein